MHFVLWARLMHVKCLVQIRIAQSHVLGKPERIIYFCIHSFIHLSIYLLYILKTASPLSSHLTTFPFFPSTTQSTPSLDLLRKGQACSVHQESMASQAAIRPTPPPVFRLGLAIQYENISQEPSKAP